MKSQQGHTDRLRLKNHYILHQERLVIVTSQSEGYSFEIGSVQTGFQWEGEVEDALGAPAEPKKNTRKRLSRSFALPVRGNFLSFRTKPRALRR